MARVDRQHFQYPANSNLYNGDEYYTVSREVRDGKVKQGFCKISIDKEIVLIQTYHRSYRTAIF